MGRVMGHIFSSFTTQESINAPIEEGVSNSFSLHPFTCPSVHLDTEEQQHAIMESTLSLFFFYIAQGNIKKAGRIRACQSSLLIPVLLAARPFSRVCPVAV